MTIRFADAATISPTGKDEIRTFLADKVDRDNDVYDAAMSQTPGTYVNVIHDWHEGTVEAHDHFTVEVFIGDKRIQSAHVYEKGHVTSHAK